MMIGYPPSSRESRRRTTPVPSTISSHKRGHYTNCIVDERALYGRVTLTFMCLEAFWECSVTIDAMSNDMCSSSNFASTSSCRSTFVMGEFLLRKCRRNHVLWRSELAKGGRS